MGGNLISWRSKKQKTGFRSGVWLKQLLR